MVTSFKMYWDVLGKGLRVKYTRLASGHAIERLGHQVWGTLSIGGRLGVVNQGVGGVCHLGGLGSLVRGYYQVGNSFDAR